MTFASIETAISQLQQGKMIILVDDDNREREGDLVIAAEKVTPDAINFMLQHTCGIICLTLHAEIVDRLQLPMMSERNKLPNQAAFTVSIEAAIGVTTGVSAKDRATTILTAVSPTSTPQDISTPGHVFPLRARIGGVLERAGHTEGSVDLMQLAGLKPAAAICELMNADGTMARASDLKRFAEAFNIPIVSINDLVKYRRANQIGIEEVAEASLPLGDVDFTIKIFREKQTEKEHVALIHKTKQSIPLVRVHSECLTGDVFGSARCDCGYQLSKSLDLISEQGGIFIYLRQEGRGIGLANKIKAYSLQSKGLDTVQANTELGFLSDQREYGVAAQILKALGVAQVKMLTNNPQKIAGLTESGIVVSERIALETEPSAKNSHYLKTKRDKLGHLLKA